MVDPMVPEELPQLTAAPTCRRTRQPSMEAWKVLQSGFRPHGRPFKVVRSAIGREPLLTSDAVTLPAQRACNRINLAMPAKNAGSRMGKCLAHRGSKEKPAKPFVTLTPSRPVVTRSGLET